jgi:PAS domain S-box-containing protein
VAVEDTRRDEELRRSEQRFRILAEGSIQGLLVFVDDKPVFANQAIANILGHESPADILRMTSSSDFIHPTEIDRVAGYRRERLQGKAAPDIYEFQAVRKDGSGVWLEACPTVAEWDGKSAVQTTFVDISERKLAQAALSESEARFKDFAEVASDWYWECDAEHRFTDYSVNDSEAAAANEDWSHMLGKTRFEQRLREDSDDEKWRRHRADLNTHRPFRNFVYKSEGGKGGYRHVRISGKPIYDSEGSFIGYRGTGSDITEARRRDEELRRSEQRFRNLIEGSIQGLVVFLDAKPVFANQAAADMLGYDSPDDILRLNSVDAYLHPAEIERLTANREARMRGEPAPEIVEFRAVCKDGSIIWLEARPTIVAWDGEPAIQAACIDVTERKLAEDALRRAHDDLEVKVRERTQELREEVAERKSVQDEATRANQAKSEFLSSMSHELRTPLNAILGFAQLLRDYSDEPLSEEQSIHVEQILDGGKHLLGLINEVLDLSRVEAGRLNMSLESIELTKIVSESLLLVRPQAEERGISLVIGAGIAAARPVRADASRLKQVLLNILSNAVKYNRDNGTVTVDAAASAADTMRVSITDTGLGIPVDKHEEVFRPFLRLGTEASKVEGTGIGLTISRQLIEAMDGKLDFDSTPGAGCTFWLEVPTV